MVSSNLDGLCEIIIIPVPNFLPSVITFLIVSTDGRWSLSSDLEGIKLWAHNFIPSRSEDKDHLPSVETIRKVITEGRKFGTGIMIISQRPSRLDETIASQCNSQIIFRMVNQKDQRATTRDSETLSVDDSKQLPNLANGH